MMTTAPAIVINGLRQRVKGICFRLNFDINFPGPISPEFITRAYNRNHFLQIAHLGPVIRHAIPHTRIRYCCGKMRFVFLRLPAVRGRSCARVIRLNVTEQIPLIPIRSPLLSGFVLAGGASERMGRSKEALLIDGQSMLKRQVRLLRSVARVVAVVGGSSQYLNDLDAFQFSDILTGRGPLAGICTALVETRSEFNLVLGCDLPFVNRRLLGYLAERAISIGSDVTVPVSREGLLQPLCAVYRRRALYAIRTSLTIGENRPRMFFNRVRCAVIPWKDLSGAGFLPSIFRNMNTPGEYDYARKRLEAPVGTFA